ncbi:hypothetical protein QBC44DRAFT_127342 [Cladorrhinum sp. PSN332]|nr:hypothetical protein QBC44DRAFT_127342 [Cladorrhinum sp. PSN332]
MPHELTTAGIGGRVLGEIEEVGLDEVLDCLRLRAAAASPNITDSDNNNNIISNHVLANTTHHRPRIFPIPGLDDLMQRHFRDTTRSGGRAPPLAVSGRYQELIYLLIATLTSPPLRKTISVVDFDGRFDAVRLLVTRPVLPEKGSAIEKPGREDLEHVYVWRPERGYQGDVYDEVERFMLYGNHGSREREWWGTVVIGTGPSLGPGRSRGAYPGHVAVIAGRTGWMRVDRVEVQVFCGKGVEQALRERDSRQAAVEAARWVASSAWGEFVFGSK